MIQVTLTKRVKSSNKAPDVLIAGKSNY